VLIRIDGWAAWSPGLESQDDWRDWARAPRELLDEGQPEVTFLPPAVRRRSTRLTKMMLRAAFDCCGEALRPDVRTVFASRHGAIHVAVKILESIVTGQPVSPMQFSHSVHNAQAGLYSIAAGNREASSSLAGEADTFCSAWIEALLHLERAPGTPVLLVTGDEPVPPKLLPLVDEPMAAYAVALLLSAGDEAAGGVGLVLEPGEPPEAGAPLAWPQATEFVRWLCSGGPEPLVLGCKRRYVFSPPAGASASSAPASLACQ
jgi:hypothetical protein